MPTTRAAAKGATSARPGKENAEPKVAKAKAGAATKRSAAKKDESAGDGAATSKELLAEIRDEHGPVERAASRVLHARLQRVRDQLLPLRAPLRARLCLPACASVRALRLGAPLTVCVLPVCPPLLPDPTPKPHANLRAPRVTGGREG